MRYIPSSPEERRRLRQAIGIQNADDLFRSIPEKYRLKKPLELPPPMSEIELTDHLQELARKNIDPFRAPIFVGAGAYRHFCPAVVDHLISRSEFYSSYTPYQPEVSQGTLQAIFEFQTMICQLTGLEVSNASLYDGASALAEGVLLAHRATRRKKIVAVDSVHPEYLKVSRTMTSRLGLEIETVPGCGNGTVDLKAVEKALDAQTAALVIQQPNFWGGLEEVEPLAHRVHEVGGLLVVAVNEAVSLGLLQAPGAQGADLVLGEAQSFGVPISFGGPYLGFMAVGKKYLRELPGRLVGEAKDDQGRVGYVLTLATREQHIRRGKATSNICTNEGLCMLAASIYMATLGKQGLRELAEQNRSLAEYAKSLLCRISGCRLPYPGPSFNEFVLELPREAVSIHQKLIRKGIVAGLPLSKFFPERTRELLICVTELNSKTQIDAMAEALRGAL